MIDYKLTGSEHSVPGRCGRQDYSCHKCPVMQQSHKQFFCSREPMNSSSPRHPSSSSKTQRMPFTLPPSASSFPSCTQAHPCQHKTKAANKAMDTWDTLILTYLCLTVHLKWYSGSMLTNAMGFKLIKGHQPKCIRMSRDKRQAMYSGPITLRE